MYLDRNDQLGCNRPREAHLDWMHRSHGTPRTTSEFSSQEDAKSHDAPTILCVLNRLGVGYIVLDGSGTILKSNQAAQETLAKLETFGDRRQDIKFADRCALPGARRHFPPGSLSWVVIPSKGGKPVVVRESLESTQDGTSIVVLLDREAKPEPNPETLKQIFGLTCAETDLAIRLAHGHAPLEVARDRHLSRTTIRSQLASLFQKTETNRQAELVALLGRIAMLP